MKNVLCFGDSNTWGYDAETYDPKTGIAKRMPFDVRWPGLTRKLLGGDYRIIENALNARTLMREDPYFPHRLGIAGLEEALDANAPLDLVVLSLGVNELKHMFNLTAGMISFGMEKLVLAAKQSYYGYPAPGVLIISPAPVHPDIEKFIFGFSFGPLAYAKSCEFSKLYREVAENHGCGYLDASSLGFTLNTIDGIHYNREDHAKLGAKAAEKIREMLDEAPGFAALRA
ncbi:MAG: GDSL-type esterase/lipase family protein [Treponema sp.]|jgi:lysophospholipase L1-like esterase|nr:GDSL-type esterase/lipase family protein [Treponema sp.]